VLAVYLINMQFTTLKSYGMFMYSFITFVNYITHAHAAKFRADSVKEEAQFASAHAALPFAMESVS
jgi:hypothetical protein